MDVMAAPEKCEVENLHQWAFFVLLVVLIVEPFWLPDVS